MTILKEKLWKWWNNLENKYETLIKYYPNSSVVFIESLLEIYNKENNTNYKL